ncbi:MAG: flavin reductase [Alphaproteobacteria bacterium]|nr:flavin reductase [Alphaproteobacteria bacterium]
MTLSGGKAHQFGARELRDALGCFATGVIVVTGVDSDGCLIGVTVNSFASVSLDPPLVSFCLGKSLRSRERIATTKGFALNVLREDQGCLSVQFAAEEIDKWHNIDYRRGIHAAPVIEPNLAVFQCLKYAEFECGDHVIIIGRVEAFEHDDKEAPLIFHRGGYRQLL